MKILAFSALALLSSAATAQESDRSLAEAVNVSIDYCDARASNAEAAIDGRVAFFIHAEGPLASILRSQGQYTTEQLPELIQRFTATSRYSSAHGHGDVIAIAADDGMVWLVLTADQRFCDIAVTELDDPSLIAAGVREGIVGNEGWSETATDANDTIWSATVASAPIEDDGPRASIAAIGLLGDLAVSDGIQAEINFAALDATQAPKKD